MRIKTYAVLAIFSLLLFSFPLHVNAQEKQARNIYAKENLVAWCIVPFDGKKRGPAERAAMCAKLGLKKVAYDWRSEHVPTFEQEILEYKKHGLDFFAFWSVHEDAFRLFEKYDMHPQIWVTLSSPKEETQADKVKAAASQLLSLVERTRKMGCKLGLYNHGGWGGEPENMVAVCNYLRLHHNGKHVGIVYNQHHAHSRIDDFSEVMALLKPHLLCLNLNGMNRYGDTQGEKILPLGEGQFDIVLLKTIRDSGYDGPIGILGHTQDDVEQRLQDNLDGLKWILPQLDNRPAGPKPTPRTWSPKQNADVSTNTNRSGALLAGKDEYRTPPITVECRAVLNQRDDYNILVASDTKKSGTHWELFSMAGSGVFTAYTPGLIPDHTRSTAMICDGIPHDLAMVYEPNRLRLFVDGKMVADQQVKSNNQASVPGGLGIGRLVDGPFRMRGEIEWLRISKTARSSVWNKPTAPPTDDATALNWNPSSEEMCTPGNAASDKTGMAGSLNQPPEHSSEFVTKLIEDSKLHGDAGRGLMVFAAAKSACLSCHKLGMYGGSVGPELTKIGTQRKPQEIIESVLWPKHHVLPEYTAHRIATEDGQTHSGYIIKEDDKQLVLHDPTQGTEHRTTILVDEIELRQKTGSLMPDNLTTAMSKQQILDLLRCLVDLGRPESMSLADINSVLHHAYAHLQGPASFPFDHKPIHPEDWPNSTHYVNRNRLYDFYTKEADYFQGVAVSGKEVPALLQGFPGLDGGTLGHWGNQNETVWVSDAWNDVQLGTMQSGVFRGDGATVPRGVCVQLGEQAEMACCFNPATLSYDAIWKDGFLKYSSVRHGFMHGVTLDGTALRPTQRGLGPHDQKLNQPFRYDGFYRIGNRVAFSYYLGDDHYLDSPWVENNEFVRTVALFDDHPLAAQIGKTGKQWPQSFETAIKMGTGSPYAVDTIELPLDNPWNIPLFGGGLNFLADGSALVCTMHGDVWRVTNFAHPSKTATWNRFASGLHHCQGMIVDDQGIFVLCRDQITQLKDLNNDGEADYYRCFSNDFETSPAGHDFICGLERDDAGYFYISSGNQGIVRISPDGQQAEIMATGFRNPDGIGLTSDGLITVPCSEGAWTPASMICAFRPGETASKSASPPFFGYRGPQQGETPQLPLVYLPRGLDNSAGGQQTVTSDRWGPLKDQLLHFSFGAGSHFLVLRDEVDGQLQGAVVPLPGDFSSGTHRGRFSDADGQLYVTGMQGWGSYTAESGCFQRVRYTGDQVQLPVGFHVYKNGVLLEFSEPLDKDIAGQAVNSFAQCWNYRYSSAYGSPEFSSLHAGMLGHDHVKIKSAHVVGSGRSLFLEMPDLQPVNQLHLRVKTNIEHSTDLFVTVNKLDQQSFTSAPGLQALTRKEIHPHPILADIAMAEKTVPNPHTKRKKGGRKITIETGSNLTYATRSFQVKSGEFIEFTLVNPDVVPHNWALVKPGTLQRVGQASNLLISDPDSVTRHYIPQTSDVLFYTNVVGPKNNHTIYFNAPKQPGRYPFLCTFPGHWLVMNGEMIVEE